MGTTTTSRYLLVNIHSTVHWQNYTFLVCIRSATISTDWLIWISSCQWKMEVSSHTLLSPFNFHVKSTCWKTGPKQNNVTIQIHYAPMSNYVQTLIFSLKCRPWARLSTGVLLSPFPFGWCLHWWSNCPLIFFMISYSRPLAHTLRYTNTLTHSWHCSDEGWSGMPLPYTQGKQWSKSTFFRKKNTMISLIVDFQSRLPPWNPLS